MIPITDPDFWKQGATPNRSALAGLGNAFRDLDFDSLTREAKTRSVFTKTMSFAIPCSEALEKIYSLSRRVVEVGAGTGLWAMLLDAKKVDIIATDIKPRESDYAQQVGSFFPVKRMGAVGAVKAYPDRDVLTVWPCYDKQWSYDVAKAMQAGRLLFYVGEHQGGCTGSGSFHDLIGEPARFEDLGSVSLPQFSGIHDNLYIYRKIR